MESMRHHGDGIVPHPAGVGVGRKPEARHGGWIYSGVHIHQLETYVANRLQVNKSRTNNHMQISAARVHTRQTLVIKP